MSIGCCGVMFLVYRGTVFFVSTVGGYITLMLDMLCGCYMFVAVFGGVPNLGAGFLSVRVCGVGYGSLVVVCQEPLPNRFVVGLVGGGLFG